MTESAVFTPFSTVLAMLGARPSWVSAEEGIRIASYQTYEQIYWNVPQTFKMVARGSEDKPIYVPSGRTIVDTTNRYVAPMFNYSVDPLIGDQSDQLLAASAFRSLFARERIRSKFASNKRYGLIRGDWAWHVYADPAKPPGRRISVHALDPASYFPVYNQDNLDQLLAIHIAEEFTDDSGKVLVRRQTYRKDPVTNLITNEDALFDPDKWQKEEAAPVKLLHPPVTLPPQIKAIPVYHIPNFEEPGNPYGSSELRGLERIMAAINQAVSDEELVLALEGLGMYATDAPPPQDDDGRDTDWILGPGRVIELQNGEQFTRVNGVNTVGPYQDHVKLLLQFLREGSATPDAAVGKVDIQVAESGISLALQMGPMLSKAEDKELIIADKMAQMFYDLRAFYEAYEKISFPTAEVLPIFGPKLPLNRKEEFDNLLAMYQAVPPLISAGYFRQQARKLGYDIPDEIEADIEAEQTAWQNVQDPFRRRLADELGGEEGSADEEELPA